MRHTQVRSFSELDIEAWANSGDSDELLVVAEKLHVLGVGSAEKLVDGSGKELFELDHEQILGRHFEFGQSDELFRIVDELYELLGQSFDAL